VKQQRRSRVSPRRATKPPTVPDQSLATGPDEEPVTTPVPPEPVFVSPSPRPLKKRQADSYEDYNEKMRPIAAALYRRLQHEDVPIERGVPDAVTWMRGRGVRITAHLRGGQSVYHLEPPTRSESLVSQGGGEGGG